MAGGHSDLVWTDNFEGRNQKNKRLSSNFIHSDIPETMCSAFFFFFFKLPQEEGSTLHSRPSLPEKNVPLVLANLSSRNLSHSLSVHRSAGFSGMAGVFRSETDY